MQLLAIAPPLFEHVGVEDSKSFSCSLRDNRDEQHGLRIAVTPTLLE